MTNGQCPMTNQGSNGQCSKNQANLAQAGLRCGPQILINHRGDVAGPERVQVQRAFDRDAVHDALGRYLGGCG